MSGIEEQNGSWLFVAPISSLVLTKHVNFEYRVNRVTFIDKLKLPLRRKRLGFPFSIGLLKKRYPGAFANYFTSYQTYAVLRQAGTGVEVKDKLLSIIRDELSILALSQLGFSRRRYNAFPSIAKEHGSGQTSYLLINTDNHAWSQPNKMTGKYADLVLDENWGNYQKKHLLNPLLKIIRGDVRISNGWKQDINNAVVLAGQSQCSTDLSQAFLWNMIAIELLLTSQGDTYVDSLPERAEAFIGWTDNWDDDAYSQKIKGIYKKRCRFVHAGVRQEITVSDVLFSDTLLLNILSNIAKNINIFTSKKALIDFSNRVQAERILGLSNSKKNKSVVRPSSFVFHNPLYTKKDGENI